MLRNATGKVPSTYQHITPVSLGATIALRELENRKGDNILREIKKVFYGKDISPFQFGNTGYLEGYEKGLFERPSM